MSFFRSVAAVYLITLVFTGCMTRLQQDETDVTDSDDPAELELSRTDDTEKPGTAHPEETETIAAKLHVSEILRHVTANSPVDYRVIQSSDVPLVQIASPPGTPQSVLLALITNDRQLSLYREDLTSSGRFRGGPTTEPLALNVRVDDVHTVTVDTRSGKPNGFHVTLRSADRGEELYVVATEGGSYSVRLPFSSVSRTVLRDLNADGLAELVQYSRVFEAGGKREIIVDSYEWDGQGFVHSRSLPLLRRLNHRLRRLRSELEAAPPGSRYFDNALQPESAASPVSELLPADTVRVPELSELTVDLGRPGWELEHDIAIYHNSDIPIIFRIQIVVRANPFLPHPITIRGLDEDVTGN